MEQLDVVFASRYLDALATFRQADVLAFGLLDRFQALAADGRI